MTLADLTIAGLGLDLAGAYLLATEFLIGRTDLARHIQQGAEGGMHPPPGGEPDSPAIRRAHTILNARLGVAALLLGFGLQALAALLQVIGLDQGGTGLAPTLWAVAAGALAFALPFGWRKLRRRKQLVNLLNEAVEKYAVPPQFPAPEGFQTYLRGTMHAGYADELGEPRGENETRQEQIRRVFGVEYPDFINKDGYP